MVLVAATVTSRSSSLENPDHRQQHNTDESKSSDFPVNSGSSCGVVGHREQSFPDSKQNVPETPNAEQTQNTMPEAACMQHAVPVTSPVQSQTTVPTAPVQERRPYGTWMMVTNKKKSVPVAKNQHHSKINGNAAPKRGNQFEALKDLQGAETQPTLPISSEKSKSKSGTAQRDKGKSPATIDPPPERLNGSSIQPLNRTFPDSVTALNSSSRGRGGRQGASRDKGRGSGRVFNAQGRSNGRGSTSVEWRDQMSTLGVFQFGGSQPPAVLSESQPFKMLPERHLYRVLFADEDT
nr:LINE-type retrotransposon LIb DNA [Ipomoea batatas]